MAKVLKANVPLTDLVSQFMIVMLSCLRAAVEVLQNNPIELGFGTTMAEITKTHSVFTYRSI